MINIKEYTIQNIQYKFDISDENIFNPHPISLLMADAIMVKKTDNLLDIGTGSGIFAIVAAKQGANSVTATDISSISLGKAKKNAALNGIHNKIDFMNGDFFSPVMGKKYNIIISNPPCMPAPKNKIFKNSGFTLAINGGEEGIDAYLKFIKSAVNHILPDGVIILPIPKWSNWRKIEKIISQYEKRLLKKKFIPFYIAKNKHFRKLILSLSEKGIVDLKMENNRIFSEVEIWAIYPNQKTKNK